MASVTDLAIIVPSRGRPDRLERLYNATMRTTALDTWLVACVDEDDPKLSAYVELAGRAQKLTLLTGPRRSLSAWTNHAADKLIAGSRYLASLGDDHVPETDAWDQRCATAIEALGGRLGGWAWGPDGFRRDTLPTWWVMSAAIVERLGYMMLPSCEHMYVDNATQALAEAAQRACYLPDVIVRHEHYLAGQAKIDETYAATNNTAQYARDGHAFTCWRNMGGLSDDVAKLREELTP